MKYQQNAQIRQWYRRAVIVPFMVFCLLVAQVAAPVAVYAEEAKKASQHVLTIYDGEQKVGILTAQNTVEEALREAGFTLEEHDITEPARDFVLTDSTHDINIRRARPIAVHDGLYRTRVMSPYRTAQQIAKQADLQLEKEDIAVLSVSEDLMLDGALERLTITRAKTFFFDEFGANKKVRTQAATVGEFLKGRSIELGENEGSNMNMSDAIEVGTRLRVWRDGVQQITVEEAVARPIKEQKDDTKEYGSRTIKEEGKDGKRSVVYELELRNGKEISRKEISSKILEAPTPQVVIVGSKSRFVPYSGGGSKSEWLAAAGIPRNMWGYADSIVRRESSWNPNARNRSSGACGLAQALPCSKVPGNPYNPVDSLRWMNGYVNGRYGGWEGAYNFWQANHWY